jgi:hypothetical protein
MEDKRELQRTQVEGRNAQLSALPISLREFRGAEKAARHFEAKDELRGVAEMLERGSLLKSHLCPGRLVFATVRTVYAELGE